MVTARPVYEARLSTYNAIIAADVPTAWWSLDETSGLTLADATGNGHTITLPNATGYAYRVAGALGPGTTGLGLSAAAITGFASATGMATGTTCSFECWINLTNKSDVWHAIYGQDNTNAFYLLDVGDHSGFNVVVYFTGGHLNTTKLLYGRIYHIVVSIVAGNGIIYVNRVADGSFTGFPGWTIARFFDDTSIADTFNGSMDELALYVGVGLSVAQVSAHYNAGWLDLTDDVVDSGVKLSYGINGNRPTDSVASSGDCSVMLRNDAQPGKALGRYSPVNPSALVGWTFGIPFRVRILYNGTYYPRFFGTISNILPDTGTHGRRQVAVTAYDVMRTLAEADVQEVAIQVGKTESEVIASVIASLPVSSRPIAMDLDPGVDLFDYALDNVGNSTKAMALIGDTARSSFYLVAQKSDGTLIGRSRHTRTTGSSTFSFSGDFVDLKVPSDLTEVYNLVRVISHPKTVDTAATTVLYALTGTAPAVSPGQTITLWGTFNDPTNAQRLIGGLSVVTALVPYPSANYDYAGNSAVDGSGSNLTSSLSIVATAFATTVKFEVTNTSGATVYLAAPGFAPMLRVRGKGVYDRGPHQYQSSSVQSYGVRPLTIDLVYQGNGDVAQSAADYVQSVYNSLVRQAQELTFVANESDAKMLFALTVEPGDIITITEPMSGLSAVSSIVQSVSLSIAEKFITCTLGLAPGSTFTSWLWGIVGHSEWGQTTTYGF